MKMFSNASNARRGARQAGLTDFAIVEIGGKFGFKPAPPMSRAEFESACVPREPAPISSITANAMRALTGVDESKPEPRKAPNAPKATKPVAKAPKPSAPKAAARKGPKAPKGATKKEQLFLMVSRGATTAEIADAFGWLPHTTRGALSRFCQMYNVEKSKLTSGGTRYKIAS